MIYSEIEKTLIKILISLNPNATVSDLARLLHDYPRLSV